MTPARWWILPTLAAALTLAPAARADKPVDESTRAAARTTAEDALTRYDAGDYAGALDLFNRADALVHAPTLGLMAARCLDKLGRQVEASERYLAVTRTQLDPKAPASQAKAIATAEQERAALLPKIPVLVIALEGASLTDARVTLDGKPVPAELLGLKRPTDPGVHKLEARRGAEVVTRDLTLKPGDTQTITLKLTGAPAAGGTPPPASPDTPPSAPSANVEGGPSNRLRTAGFVGVGVGGAGLLIGAITGGVAISTKGSLDAAGCSSGHCPTSQASAVSKYNTMRLVSGPSLIVGALLAAAGVTLVVVGKRPEGKAQAAAVQWAPWVGARSAGVEGAF